MERETETQNHLQALQASEIRYRRLFEAARDGILILNAETGEIDDVNPYMIDMLHYSREEFVGMKLWEVSPFKDKVFNQAAFEELQDKGYIRYKDLPLETKEGKPIAVEFVSNVYKANGDMVIQCNIRNITERKSAEETLRISQERLSEAMDLAKIVYWEGDPTDNMLIFNDVFYAFYATTAEQEGGYRMTKENYTKRFIHPDDLQLVRRFMEQNNTRTDSDFSSDLEHRIVRRDGKVRHILARTKIIKDDSDRIVRRYGANQDITVRKQSEEALNQSLKKLRRNLMGTIQAMSSMVEIRDPYTAGHEKIVSMLARAIANELGLPSDVVDNIRMAASIHDIGKISVPAEILSKPGRLTDIEMKLIQMHSQTGYDILKDVDLPYPIAKIVLQHHERLNGSGYPQGVKADDILLESRIVSVADVVEAMASHRPYRPALGIDMALEEIEKNKGIFYDAVVVDACVRLFREKGFKLE